jgi:hypothetical protein
MREIRTLADVVELARPHAGRVQYEGKLTGRPNRGRTRTLRVGKSSERGGCGLRRCNCSPGWWVTADLKDRTVAIGFPNAARWRAFLDKMRVLGVNVSGEAPVWTRTRIFDLPTLSWWEAYFEEGRVVEVYQEPVFRGLRQLLPEDVPLRIGRKLAAA